MKWEIIIASLIAAVPPTITAILALHQVMKSRREARLADLKAVADREELKRDVNGKMELALEAARREGFATGIERGISKERTRGEDAARLLVEASPVGLLMVGPHGRIKMLNAQSEKLFGYSREELIGASLDVLIPPRFRPDHAGHLKDYLDNPRPRQMGVGLSLFGLRKDGKEIALEIALAPLTMPDGVFVVASVLEVKK